MLVQRLWETVQQYKLIAAGETVMVAVSGGPDSMALLHGLWRLKVRGGWQVTAVHVDHQLRGEAALDAQYVRERCREWKIPLEIHRVDVPRFLEERGGNLQAVAREFRYTAFRDAARKFGAQKVALAHHANDQVETVLMRFVRGTGVGGLAGMPLRRPLDEREVIRPLLAVSRQEIETYCFEQGLNPREDESNRSFRYTRNRVRHKLIPEMESYNPQFSRAVLNLVQVVSDEEKVWSRLVEEAAQRIVKRQAAEEAELDVIQLRSYEIALQRRVIKLILSCLVQDDTIEVPLETVEQIRNLALQDVPSGELDLPGEIAASREYDLLHLFHKRIKKKKDPLPSLPVIIPGKTHLPDGRFLIAKRLSSLSEVNPSVTTAVFDADMLTEPLKIRARQAGDRMQPFGLNGSKKVKAIFIDHKVPRRMRDQIPLIVHGSQIIWIPGICRSDFAPVTANTKRFLCLVWSDREWKR